MTESVSDEVLQVTQCAGKDPFDSYAQAQAVAMKTKRDKHAAISPYLCKFCHKYHIGSRFVVSHPKRRMPRKK